MNELKNKKEQQLGMNPSTASHKLMKDILFHLISRTEYLYCYRCGQMLQRDNFSIEHKDPWLDSSDPKALYFDLENIAFSHMKCNYSAARHKEAVCGTRSKYEKGCRCEDCTDAEATYRKSRYTTEQRRAKYLRNGT